MISTNEITSNAIGSTSIGPYPYNRTNCTLTVREKLLQHRQHSCPGNVGHTVRSKGIKDRIFNRYYKLGHKAYVMYWRARPGQYKAMRDHFKNA